MTKAIIVGHYNLPRALSETLESIVGKLDDVLFISNTGLSSEKLTQEVKRAIDILSPEETIIFVDVPGGSCAISCLNILKTFKGIPVICGVNLLMLLEFFINRERYPRDRLVEILVAKGRESIKRLGGNDLQAKRG
ncbi:MAG: hypothetical protein ABIL05_00160 [candidate division WOR-3 bacterium]